MPLRRSAFPKRRVREPMNVRQSGVIRCPSHLGWLRNTRECLASSSAACSGRMEAHHVRENGNAGTGIKPPDSDAVPLCAHHHRQLHNVGSKTFEAMHGVDLDKTAAACWRESPHGVKFRAQQGRG